MGHLRVAVVLVEVIGIEGLVVPAVDQDALMEIKHEGCNPR